MKTETFITTFNNYRIIGRISEGGAGYIFNVEDEDGHPFAVKVIKPEVVSKIKLDRFKREIYFGQRSNHENIIKVIAHGKFIEDGESYPFYVMPLYSCSFDNLIKRSIEIDKGILYFDQILEGICYAHKNGIIHRDIKPQNILFDERQDNLIIADFGIAHFKEEELITEYKTHPRERLANFLYAAPEQKILGKEVTEKADIFALGLILNEVFTREIPLSRGYETIGSRVPELKELDDLVAKMIDQSPEKRPNIEAVRSEFMFRIKEFRVASQIQKKQNELLDKEISEDPSLANPVEIIDFGWMSPDFLEINFNQQIPDLWMIALKNVSGPYSGTFHPTYIRIIGSKGTMKVPGLDNYIREAKSFITGWIPKANKIYLELVKQKRNAKETERKRQIAEDIGKLKRHNQILNLLNKK